jgi:hypothetical protein
MAAPSLSGITIESTFSSGSNPSSGTLVGGGSQFQNSEEFGQTGIDFDVQASSVAVEQKNTASMGCRYSMSQIGASNPLNVSGGKLLAWHVNLAPFPESGNFDVLTEFQTFANGGFRIRLYSNSGFTTYREYDIFGSDTIFAGQSRLRNTDGWQAIVIDPSASGLEDASSGTFNPATIYAIEYVFVKSAGAANIIFALDQLVTSNGMVMVAGDVSTPGTFADFASYAEVTQNTALCPALGQTIYSKLPLKFGDGSTASRMVVADGSVIFAGVDGASDNPRHSIVTANTLGFTFDLSGSCHVDLRRCSMSSTAKWVLDISVASGGTFTWDGGTVSNIGTNAMDADAALHNLIFDSCDKIAAAASQDFSGSTFSASTDAVAAFIWDGTQDITGCRFLNNTTPAGAVEIASAGTYNLSSNTFSGNTKDFNVTATSGTVTITVDSASSTDHSGGFSDSGYIAAKVSTAGATVVISAPVVSYARGVSGAPVGSAIAIFKRSSSLVADRSQFTLAAGNNSGNGTLVIAETIPNDTPATGFVRVLRDDGTEDRLAFTSWAGSTFTLSGTLPVTYTAGNGVYVGYIDVLGSVTGDESVDLEYVSNRSCVLVVRLGSGGGRIREIRQDITVGAQDIVLPISGFADTINTTT